MGLGKTLSMLALVVQQRGTSEDARKWTQQPAAKSGNIFLRYCLAGGGSLIEHVPTVCVITTALFYYIQPPNTTLTQG